MPKYKVLQKSFIGNRLVEEGETIDYDGEPSDNLEPVDKAAKKAAESVDTDAAAAESSARLAAAANTGSPDGVVDTDAAAAGQGETTGEAQP